MKYPAWPLVALIMVSSACGMAKPIKRLTIDAEPGRTFFDPTKDGAAYRYGPSLLINPDGSIDAYFSSPGGSVENKPDFKVFHPFPENAVEGDSYYQWDWIRHRKLTAEGKWASDETIVLMPTPFSRDKFSVCDPCVIKLGKYYYLGVTAADNLAGNRAEIFVSRSSSPTGPFEKWNGSGWGGLKPLPIVPFRTPLLVWGAGEPSFVRLGKTLYIYYTVMSAEGPQNARVSTNRTMIATAPADDENWPAKIKFIGTAWDRLDNEDSADVKYIPAYKSFISVSTASRMGPNSFIAVRTSQDGLSWSEPISITKNMIPYLHNCGISADTQGHIDLKRPIYLGYAYSATPGVNWANWNTELHSVKITWEK